jgi:L-asparagine transporter-like permease
MNIILLTVAAQTIGGHDLTGLLISFLILVVVLAIIGGLIWCIQTWISPLPPPVLMIIAIILVILVIIWGIKMFGGGG